MLRKHKHFNNTDKADPPSRKASQLKLTQQVNYQFKSTNKEMSDIVKGVSRSSISVDNIAGILKNLADVITTWFSRSQVEASHFIDVSARSVVHTSVLTGIVSSVLLAKLCRFNFLSTEASMPSNGMPFNQNIILLDGCARNREIVNSRLARETRVNPDTAAGTYHVDHICDVPMIGVGVWNPSGSVNVFSAFCAPTARSGGSQPTDTPSREAAQLQLPTAGQLSVCTTDTVPHELNLLASGIERNEDKMPELVAI
jgi:hypothetical protein